MSDEPKPPQGPQPPPEPLAGELLANLQRRRIDPLRDRDVADKVALAEELSPFEKQVRLFLAQKKTIGSFLVGLGTFLTAAAGFYPVKALFASATLAGVAGGLLLGGGATRLKSDEYEKTKNALLKERGLL